MLNLKIGLVFFLFLLSPEKITKAGFTKEAEFFVLWNVGQGSASTFVLKDKCVHYDLGGEFIHAEKLISFCGHKLNQIIISHGDLDHVSFLPLFLKRSLQRCFLIEPEDPKWLKRKRELKLVRIPSCSETPPQKQQVQKLTPDAYLFKPLQKGLKANDYSLIFLKHKILLTGDSPSKMEKLWLKKLKLNKVKILVAGHHGSKTSTSKELLAALPELKMVLVSSRWLRYHHPHPKTLSRLWEKKLKVIKTEDWGNLYFEL